jgi:nitrite reductase/ring-hydroxylating ferredoxin subunit/DMSO/TMAO reductase YedYZ heme-binding membrane subunit
MSVTYRAIGWNRQKRLYDTWIAGASSAYLLTFIGLMTVRHPDATIETALIRAFGTLALLLLHVILSIGPLCRLDARFLPLLYNRRHLGVTMFLAAAAHAILALVQFHGFSDVNPVVSLLTTSRAWLSVSGFPFQIAGALALVILFAMASTSHDFWLHTLGPRAWKSLHMGVYAAYALIVVHVAFGALQSETDPALPVVLLAGVTWIVGLHLITGRKEAGVDRAGGALRSGNTDAFVEVCGVDEIPDGRARVACPGDERIAIFRYNGTVSAISNVCQHQNGPLGEGRIVRGCVVCPWHGYEYLPDSGASPPPFTERVATYRVEIRKGRVWVDPRPFPPGTRLEPARIAPAAEGA